MVDFIVRRERAMPGRIALLAALLAAVIGPAVPRAQTNPMQTFIGSDFYRGLVNQAIAALPPTVLRKCPTLASNGSQVTVLMPVSFAAGGKPDAGLWRHSFRVSGCGNDTTLNLYFSVVEDEKIITIFGVPGTTHVGPTLQRDTMQYANAGAMAVAPDCRNFDVANTRFEGYGVPNPPIPDPGPTSHSRPWWETWTMAGCDRTIDVPLDFVPDSTGTQIIQPGGGTQR
jgi:hypothetical protein